MVIKDQSGFTLLELTAVIVIASVLSIFFYSGYAEEEYKQRVYATLRNAQDLANAAYLLRREVSNTQSATYAFSYSYNLSDQKKIEPGSIKGNTIPSVTPAATDKLTNKSYVFMQENNMFSTTVELDGVDWYWHGATSQEFSTQEEAADEDANEEETDEQTITYDATRITVYPRWMQSDSVDVTSISRHIKYQYYWQNVR